MAESHSKGQPTVGKACVTLGENGPMLRFPLANGHGDWLVYWHSIESFHQETPDGQPDSPVVMHFKGGKRIEVAGTYEDVRRVVQEAELLSKSKACPVSEGRPVIDWIGPGTYDIRGDVQASIDRMKTGAFGVALEDSQRIGTGKYVCNVRLIDGSERWFEAERFKDARRVGSDSCEVRLTNGTSYMVGCGLDEVLQHVRDKTPPAEPEPAAQVETVTLRDRFALAALPAITEKYCRENRNVLDRENLAFEVWQLADEMMKARGE